MYLPKAALIEHRLMLLDLTVLSFSLWSGYSLIVPSHVSYVFRHSPKVQWFPSSQTYNFDAQLGANFHADWQNVATIKMVPSKEFLLYF